MIYRNEQNKNVIKNAWLMQTMCSLMLSVNYYCSMKMYSTLKQDAK